MRKIVGVFGAGLIGAALLAAGPAQAACSWNGYAWHCWDGHHRAEIRHDRNRLQAESRDARRDRHHVARLREKLQRDMYSGNSGGTMRDMHRLHRSQARLRADRRDVSDAKREIREDRAGY